MRCARELLLAASVIGACASDEPDVRQYRDVGQVCLESSDGQRLTFRIFTGVGTGDQCLSSCDENVVSCRATLEGTRIDLSTLLETTPIPGVEICTAGCENASGTCLLDVPSPGTYRFRFAGRVDRATLPLEGAVGLFEERDCQPALNPP
jgi:hypothetical protein